MLRNKVGQVKGKLTVIALDEETKKKKNSKINYWLCLCECGNTRTLSTSGWNRLRTPMCLKCKEDSYMSDTVEYTAWVNAKQRCFNPKNPDYPNYGGAGITMCDQFANSFDEFYKEVGPKPSKGVWLIDRIDTTKNYEPGNLRWAPGNLSSSNVKATNSTGHKNVYKRKGRDYYEVRIAKDGVDYRVGRFDTLSEAIKARDAKFKELYSN